MPLIGNYFHTFLWRKVILIKLQSKVNQHLIFFFSNTYSIA